MTDTDARKVEQKTTGERKREYVEGLLTAEDEDSALAEAAREHAMEHIVQLLQNGATPAQAIDLFGVEVMGFSQTEWAERRETTPANIHQTIKKGKVRPSRSYFDDE